MGGLDWNGNLQRYAPKKEISNSNSKQLPKVAVSCQKLVSVAKSCHQLPKVAVSCQKFHQILICLSSNFVTTQWVRLISVRCPARVDASLNYTITDQLDPRDKNSRDLSVHSVFFSLQARNPVSAGGGTKKCDTCENRREAEYTLYSNSLRG